MGESSTAESFSVVSSESRGEREEKRVGRGGIVKFLSDQLLLRVR